MDAPEHVQVAIVGAGPAGAALAQILASRGVRVALIERQSDFAREFRGEVLMPSGLRVLAAMGLEEAVAALPLQRPDRLLVHRNRQRVFEFELGPEVLPEAPIALSQPHLLELLVARASEHPGFHFVRGGVVRDLWVEGERVRGLRLQARAGESQLRCDLVVGADGRGSVVRRRGGFETRSIGTPMDVVWCKMPWSDADAGNPARVYVGGGHLLIALRSPDDRLQVAWVILKGTYGELRSRGLEGWVEEMAHHVDDDLAAHLRAHVSDISRPFLLDARTERVRGWSAPGVLLLGDAAHTMSPVGGQGLNVALRDAVVAANHLVPVLREGGAPEALDAAAARVEPERGPEIDRIQQLAAQPPRLVMRAGPIAAMARGLILWLLRSPRVRSAAAGPANDFFFGVTDVQLRV